MNTFNLRFLRLATIVGIGLGLTACGAGQGSDKTATAVPTFTVRGEANRVAALYRVQRDMASIVQPYAKNASTLIALNGKSVACTGGGNVAYSYNAGSGGGVGQRFDATFTNCSETIGLINGTLTLIWNSSQDNPGQGTFTPGWSATISIDGVAYGILTNSTLVTNLNSTSGVQQTRIQVYSLSSVQPPSGPSAFLQNVIFTVQTQPGSATLDLVNLFDNVNATTGDAGAAAAGNLRNPGTCTVNSIAASAAILGVGNPQTCSWTYIRGNRSGGDEGISGTATTTSGLLNIIVNGTRSQLSDAAQYDWPTLIQTYNWNMDGR